MCDLVCLRACMRVCVYYKCVCVCVRLSADVRTITAFTVAACTSAVAGEFSAPTQMTAAGQIEEQRVPD